MHASIDPRAPADPVRLSLHVRGTVQGVGFRPAVWRLATELGLSGFVCNDASGVRVEIEGPAEAAASFVEKLRRCPPAAARIERIDEALVPTTGSGRFAIEPSAAAAAGTAAIPADRAPCDACLRELRDPAARRHRYPLLACTDCGPRYSIATGLPWDRERTTLAAFPLCASCTAEYADPADRRFHAEAMACPSCGPRVALHGPDGARLAGVTPVEAAAAAIASGAVVAVKGVGGYLLAVDAASREAVALLRKRKGRPHKPFALAVRDLEAAAAIARLDPCTRNALQDPARPIVLVEKRPDTPVAPGVAPGLREVGIALPASPLQQLLLDLGPPVQVMTSGNRSGEPIACSEGEAFRQLHGIADLFLVHERPIQTRLDDSVVRPLRGRLVPIRRARGFVPDPIALPVDGPPILAVGAQHRVAICLAAGRRALLSQHLGDLEEPAAFALFEETVEKLARLSGIEPVAIAHDLHPDYAATRWARAAGLPTVAVQHHHAHVAACLAEHGRTGPAIGVAFDGTGAGPDGTAWGGEFLLADLLGFRRLGHLRPLPLPGGERAIRAPWRLGIAALVDAGLEPAGCGPAEAAGAVAALIGTAFAPSATGAGRWFDAVAALCGLGHHATWDGQAAAELEAVAPRMQLPPFRFELSDDEPFVADLRPAIRAIAATLRAGGGARIVSGRFHETCAQLILAGCRRARAVGAPATVVLSGGCFQNRILASRAGALLGADGFEVLTHRLVPPGDGGIALGQAAVAAARLARQEASLSEAPAPHLVSAPPLPSDAAVPGHGGVALPGDASDMPSERSR